MASSYSLGISDHSGTFSDSFLFFPPCLPSPRILILSSPPAFSQLSQALQSESCHKWALCPPLCVCTTVPFDGLSLPEASTQGWIHLPSVWSEHNYAWASKEYPTCDFQHPAYRCVSWALTYIGGQLYSSTAPGGMAVSGGKYEGLLRLLEGQHSIYRVTQWLIQPFHHCLVESSMTETRTIIPWSQLLNTDPNNSYSWASLT